MTIQLTFTPEIQEALNYERYHHPVPLVQRRMEVLWLKSHGLAHELIARLAGVSENTMRDYFALYAAGGLDKLKEVNLYRPTGALEAHTTTLEAYFRATAGDYQGSPTRNRDLDRHPAQRDAGAHLPEKNSIYGAAKSA